MSKFAIVFITIVVILLLCVGKYIRQRTRWYKRMRR